MDNRTEQLRAIMKRHKLKAKDVAEIVGRSQTTVRIWRCASSVRPIPASVLRLLELELDARNSQGE
jgi:transcriptional regulator with XRE-family HTH domain